MIKLKINKKGVLRHNSEKYILSIKFKFDRQNANWVCVNEIFLDSLWIIYKFIKKLMEYPDLLKTNYDSKVEFNVFIFLKYNKY